MFLIPLLSALLQASSSTIDKVILRMRRVTFQMYAGASFPLIFLVTLILFLVFRPPFSFTLFTGTAGLFFVITVLITIGNNLIFYRALKTDSLGEMQMLDLVHNIPVIVLTSLFFADERNGYVIVLALIATLLIIWSHWENHHLKIAKKSRLFLLWSITFAPLMAPIAKVLLVSWHPISLELARTGAVALLLWPFFVKQVRETSPRTFTLLVITNTLSALAWILLYFSYQYFGVVYSTLLFLLHPLFVYFASLAFLKEKFQWKKLTAFIIILCSIAAAQFFI